MHSNESPIQAADANDANKSDYAIYLLKRDLNTEVCGRLRPYEEDRLDAIVGANFKEWPQIEDIAQDHVEYY
jgi:hypothetical protein